MNEFVYKLTLDLNCAKTPPVICSGQFDKGRKFEFTITANGEPYDVTGCSAVLKGVRTDGSHFAVECTVSNGKIIKTLDDTTLSVRGKTVAKLVISDSSKSYSTQIFIIDVDSALDGDITVADDYSILNRLIDKTNLLISYVTPQMYGAKADGVNDDTESIQNAIDSGKAVYIPKGIYKTGQIVISGSKAKIFGAGRGNTIIKHNDSCTGDTSVIKITDNSKCSLSDLTIMGGGSSVIKDGYTGTKYHGLEITNCTNGEYQNTINNLDVTQCLNNGIHLSYTALGAKLSNIHTWYNIGNGLYNEGYGNKVVNLDTHQNYTDGIKIFDGGFNGSNIKAWGNQRDGINLDKYTARNDIRQKILCVVLTNVSTQQNSRYGLMMTNCAACVITGLQSTANNYKSETSFNDGESLYTKTAGILLVNHNHDNYIQGNIISCYDHWNSFEENSIRISGADNVNNIIDVTVNSSLIGPDMYNVCFNKLNGTIDNYNKLSEYALIRQAYDNPLNTIKINGKVVSSTKLTNVSESTKSVAESFMKKSDGTNYITVSAETTDGKLLLNLSDYGDLPAYKIESITSNDKIDVSKVAYRRGYELKQIDANTNKVLYLNLTAKVSQYKAFGVFPLVQVMYKRYTTDDNGEKVAIDDSAVYEYLDYSSDYVKSNVIFNTDYINKKIALDLSKYCPYIDSDTKKEVTTNLTIYFRLCVMKLSDTTISNTAINDTAKINIKEFSYKLSDGSPESWVQDENHVLTDADKAEIADIVINEYDSSIMAILGGDSDATE